MRSVVFASPSFLSFRFNGVISNDLLCKRRQKLWKHSTSDRDNVCAAWNIFLQPEMQNTIATLTTGNDTFDCSSCWQCTFPRFHFHEHFKRCNQTRIERTERVTLRLWNETCLQAKNGSDRTISLRIAKVWPKWGESCSRWIPNNCRGHKGRTRVSQFCSYLNVVLGTPEWNSSRENVPSTEIDARYQSMRCQMRTFFRQLTAVNNCWDVFQQRTKQIFGGFLQKLSFVGKRRWSQRLVTWDHLCPWRNLYSFFDHFSFLNLRNKTASCWCCVGAAFLSQDCTANICSNGHQLAQVHSSRFKAHRKGFLVAPCC